MLKQILCALGGCLFALGSFAQSTQIDQVLREIEQNNKELKAFQLLMESRKLDFKAKNNLPDPQLSAFYLPFGEHNTGDYSEFQVSQSFEFPTVYAARFKWIEKQNDQLQLEYNQRRQDILLSAKEHCFELITLAKRKEVEQLRVAQAKQAFDQVQQLFEKEQVGILELNKAKIAWMQDQFQLENIENKIQNMLLSLQKLNGGNSMHFKQSDFFNSLFIESPDSVWQQIRSNDPAIKALEGSEAVAMHHLRVQKNQLLPNLSVGFNYQGVMGNNYSGIYGGLSIPLWNGRNKVKSAKAQYQYRQSNTGSIITERQSDFMEQYNLYDLKLRKYREYKTTMEGLNNESLLFEAYSIGQISFMDYYVELQFYRQAYDKMLEIEKELHQLKAEIFKYQL